MNRPDLIEQAFNAAASEMQRYIVALESENAKLNRQIARLLAENVSIQHRAETVEKELKEEAKKHGFSLNVTFAGDQPAKSDTNSVQPGQ